VAIVIIVVALPSCYGGAMVVVAVVVQVNKLNKNKKYKKALLRGHDRHRSWR
jgi:hypothetical protein